MTTGAGFWRPTTTGGGGGGGLPNAQATYIRGSASSTTSGSFVNYGTVAATITKAASGSKLLVAWSASYFCTATSTNAQFAIRVDGVDTACGIYVANTANRHDVVSGVIALGASLVAGTYTVQLRWRRETGSGTLFPDGNDFGSISVTEVAG